MLSISDGFPKFIFVFDNCILSVLPPISSVSAARDCMSDQQSCASSFLPENCGSDQLGASSSPSIANVCWFSYSVVRGHSAQVQSLINELSCSLQPQSQYTEDIKWWPWLLPKGGKRNDFSGSDGISVWCWLDWFPSPTNAVMGFSQMGRTVTCFSARTSSSIESSSHLFLGHVQAEIYIKSRAWNTAWTSSF